MILTHRIELDPTVKQRKYFAMAAGCARFVWNWALAEWERQYEAGEKPDWMKLRKQFNAIKYERFAWMKEIHRDSHSQPFSNIGKAYKSWFSGTAGKPQFKKKDHSRTSFYVANGELGMHGYVVRLPRIGRVRMREQLRFTGKIMSATVSRTADRWFISIAVDIGDHSNPRTGNEVVGVDLGIKVAATLSTGEQIQSPRPLKTQLAKLRRTGRQLSRKKKGSKNRHKAQMKLAKLHYRISNIRKDFLHKLTTRLCHENQVVAIEDLNVGGMMKNRKLARSICDIGFYEFRRQLEYKSLIYGMQIVAINRFFPSSKTCRTCGLIDDDQTLSDRTFRCDGCGHSEDRDLNAAHNIRSAGLAQTYACGPEGSGQSRKRSAKPCRVEAGTKTCPLGTT